MLLNIDIIIYHSDLYWLYHNDIATMLVPRTVLGFISIWGKKVIFFYNLIQMNYCKNACKGCICTCLHMQCMKSLDGLLVSSSSKGQMNFMGLGTIIGTLPIGINFVLESSLNVQIMQSIGFLGPAFFLTQLSHVRNPAMAVLCMACSQV